MKNELLKVIWPDGKISYEEIGSSWLEVASRRNIEIPTGCLGGSCGTCEIEVNGEVIRACISTIEKSKNTPLHVSFVDDPYW
ncbi:2Fe-2S iron-sulfur cluster binding domain-containing protein [Prochlorococcus sp. MIT 1341]|uniref:2Fe-2S iron-sulfur cluster binding domain-containing protein n=1 Tax=Prochlorococcus sp. MIT 1341 TaxID=3096221 RepID=UPI002A750F28|nr:2Fe-2S iron-sulfur cluster-binding protein [Prochlorococcus sp. MIT 1341]